MLQCISKHYHPKKKNHQCVMITRNVTIIVSMLKWVIGPITGITMHNHSLGAEGMSFKQYMRSS